MKLSHSAVNRFLTCPTSYKYHYKDRLREPVKNSSLFFGSAVDASINKLLLDKKNNKLHPLNHYLDLFNREWSFGDLNGEKTPLKLCTAIAYANSDIDFDLISNDDAKDLGFLSVDLLEEYYNKILPIKRTNGIEGLNGKAPGIFNGANWHCLNAKGKLMITTYYNDILPLIKEVLAVQVKTTLDDGEGNEVDSYLDAVLDFGEGPVVVDNKTSTMKYEQGSASSSHQLALYKHAIGGEYDTDRTAFIVLYKAIQKNRIKTCEKCGYSTTESRAKTCDKEISGKRCFGMWKEVITPKATFEVIHGRISEHFENEVVGNYDSVLKAIQSGVFYKNWSSCSQPWGKCAYYQKCHENKDEGLVQL